MIFTPFFKSYEGCQDRVTLCFFYPVYRRPTPYIPLDISGIPAATCRQARSSAFGSEQHSPSIESEIKSAIQDSMPLLHVACIRVKRQLAADPQRHPGLLQWPCAHDRHRTSATMGRVCAGFRPSGHNKCSEINDGVRKIDSFRMIQMWASTP